MWNAQLKIHVHYLFGKHFQTLPNNKEESGTAVTKTTMACHFALTVQYLYLYIGFIVLGDILDDSLPGAVF